jgi:hypothetical protein
MTSVSFCLIAKYLKGCPPLRACGYIDIRTGLADAEATTGIDLTIMELQDRTDPIGNQPDLNQIRGLVLLLSYWRGSQIASEFGRQSPV